MRATLFILVLPALLFGCMTTTRSRDIFACEGGIELRVAFAPDRAIVRTSDGVIHTLPQAEAASGARYTNGTHELWTKGREATWTVGRMIPIQCRSTR